MGDLGHFLTKHTERCLRVMTWAHTLNISLLLYLKQRGRRVMIWSENQGGRHLVVLKSSGYVISQRSKEYWHSKVHNHIFMGRRSRALEFLSSPRPLAGYLTIVEGKRYAFSYII
jgi:hypothetical protein